MRGQGTLNQEGTMIIQDLLNMTALIGTMSPEAMKTTQEVNTMNAQGIMITGGTMMHQEDQEMKATMADHLDMREIGDMMITIQGDTLIIRNTMDHAEEVTSHMTTLKT